MATVTIKDIASQLNISPATVSLALNNRPGVNPQTRENIIALAQELSYTGSGRVKINKKKSGKFFSTIGFLVYKRHGKIITDSEFFTALISAIESVARSHGYTIMLIYCTGENEIEDTLKLSKESGIAGLLILGTELFENDMQLFYEMNLPSVVLDCDILGCKFDTVTIHNEDGIWRGLNYLKELGHNEIGYMRSSFSIKNFEQRFFAYQHYMNYFGVSVDEQKIFMLEPNIEGSYNDICELIRQNIKFPTAVIADNDLIALGAIKAFNQFNIRVPEDISIVGFDDIPMSSFIEPKLTSIYVSCEEFGRAAVEQLIWRHKNIDAIPRRISISTALNIRSSVMNRN